jgi:hypothetical protein
MKMIRIITYVVVLQNLIMIIIIKHYCNNIHVFYLKLSHFLPLRPPISMLNNTQALFSLLIGGQLTGVV